MLDDYSLVLPLVQNELINSNALYFFLSRLVSQKKPCGSVNLNNIK
jgi:hypothetical protein